MTYERFSELWDAFVTNRPRASEPTQIKETRMSATENALIEYAHGDKTKVNAVRKLLDRGRDA
jgi:hypothetical protein